MKGRPTVDSVRCPIDFLTDAEVAQYDCYTGSPSRIELDKLFSSTTRIRPWWPSAGATT
jgi:hypothetical protein